MFMIPRPATKEEIMELVERAIKKAGSADKLVDMTGWSLRAVNYYKKGEQRPSPARIEKLLEICQEVAYPEAGTGNAPVSAVAESPAGYNEYVEIPLHEATGSMGGGSTECGDRIQQHLSFRRGWLDNIHARPENLFCIYVFGDSMSPTVTDGSVVLVDKGRKAFASNKVFYIRHDKQMFLKRLVGTERDLKIVSDNDPGHPVEVKAGGEFVDGDDFEIIGRALWMGRMID